MKKIKTLLMLVASLFLSSCGGTKVDEDHIHNYNIENITNENKASEATCLHKATYYYSCSCGALSTNTFEYGEFNSSNHELDATWKITSSTHKKTYDCCGKVVVEEALHSGGVSTCTSYAKCNICSEEYGELDSNNHTGTLTYESVTSSTHKAIYSCCGASTIENHTFSNGKCTLCNYEKGTTDEGKFTETGWNSYVASLKTLEKLSNVSLSIVDIKNTLDSSNNVTETEENDYSVVTYKEANLIHVKKATTLTEDDEEETTTTDDYYKYIDNEFYLYSSIDEGYYAKYPTDITEEVSLYQNVLSLDYIYDVSYSSLVFKKSSKTYTYTDENGDNSIFTFKNDELYKIEISVSSVSGYKTKKTLTYDFDSTEVISLPSSSFKGSKISESNFNALNDNLNEEGLLKSFSAEISGSTTTYDLGIPTTITISRTVNGDKEKNLIYEQETKKTTVTSSILGSYEITLSDTRKYLYFGTSNVYETNYDSSTKTYSDWEVSSDSESTYLDEVNNMTYYSSLKNLKYNNLIYNEIYDAYNDYVNSTGSSVVLYVFKNDLISEIRSTINYESYEAVAVSKFDFSYSGINLPSGVDTSKLS